MAETTLTRFWVGWRSGNYEDEGCTAPAFQTWVTGSRDRDDDRDDLTMCALVDAPSEAAVWESIQKHFPDFKERFCEEQSNDWIPSERFRDFENRTRL